MPTTRSRPSSIQELFNKGILESSKTPPSAAQALLDLCNKYNLALSDDAKEAYIIRIPKVPMPQTLDDFSYNIYVHTSTFFRICRETKLWLPGKISFVGAVPNLTAYATCYTRASEQDPSWVESGAHANYFNYYQRMPDGKTAQDRWEFTPDIALATVAEVLAARKALGDLLDDVNTESGLLEVTSDERIISKLQEREKAAKAAR